MLAQTQVKPSSPARGEDEKVDACGRYRDGFFDIKKEFSLFCHIIQLLIERMTATSRPLREVTLSNIERDPRWKTLSEAEQYMICELREACPVPSTVILTLQKNGQFFVANRKRYDHHSVSFITVPGVGNVQAFERIGYKVDGNVCDMHEWEEKSYIYSAELKEGTKNPAEMGSAGLSR